LARKLLRSYFELDADNHQDNAPTRLLAWVDEARQAVAESREPPLLVARDGRRLLASLHTPGQEAEGEWLLVLREENHAAAIEALLAAFRLTQREAGVLFWATKGKTSKDIGDILGTSPRTVNKHLEHVFEKLGVETRTAAANLAMSKMGVRGGEE